MSRILSARQSRALERIGDVMIPGVDGFPSFSATGSIAHVDPLLEVTPAEDVAGLKVLLNVLSFLPTGVLAGFLRMVRREDHAPGVLAGAFRNIHVGLKGLVMSLYYSNRTGPTYTGPKVHALLGYELRVVKP
jgi:hypothetical protein